MSGTIPVASISGQTSFAALTVDNSGVGDLFTASSSGLPRFVITQAGNVGVGTTLPAYPLDISRTTADASIRLSANFGQQDEIFFNDNTNGLNMDIYRPANSRDLRIYNEHIGMDQIDFDNTNGYMGINTDTPIAILDVRGVGNKSLTGTIPVASISGQTSFASAIIDQSGLGDIFTASKSGSTKFVINNSGNIQFNGSTNFLTTLTSAATGAQTITFPAAGGGAGTVCYQNSSACGFVTGTNYWQSVNAGTITPYNSTVDLLVGGVATSSASFHLYGATALQGTTAVASIAANTSFAGMVIDNKGSGDLFTASTSGLTRFVVDKNGNVGIGRANPVALLDIRMPGSNFGVVEDIGNSGDGVQGQYAFTHTSFSIWAGSGDALQLGTNFGENMRIASGGTVGIIDLVRNN
jgi:hypothetical protein